MSLEKYETTELKSMAFDVIRQITLLVKKRDEFLTELAKRDELIKDVEVTPDVRNTDNS